jgi:IstB-like ATP binding protein
VKRGERAWTSPEAEPPPVGDVARFARLERYGVPYREALLVMDEDPAGEEFRETEPVYYAKKFLREVDAGRRNVLVLAGQVGAGKTVASVYVMDERPAPAMRYGRGWGARHPLFRGASDLVSLGLYGKESVREDLAAAPVLVLDDVGAEYIDNAGVYRCFIDWLLNKRYGSAGLTVITTNLSGESFGEQYGERIYDRLRHRAVWYDVEGGSLRGHVPEIE